MLLVKVSILIISTLVILLSLSLNIYEIGDVFLPKLPDLEFEDVWRLEVTENITKPYDIQINVPDVILKKLGDQLKESIWHKSLSNSNFKYGFNSDELDKFIKYWLNNYNWRHWEIKVNEMKHYFLTVKGIKIQYVHMKPLQVNKDDPPIPILLLHSWPGSFFDFYKVIPELLKNNFEVICPSYPGFGWSEAVEKPGYNVLAAADTMFSLMDQLKLGLGPNKAFVVHGGDWGSIIANSMARMRPERIAGLHVNMIIAANHDLRHWIKVFIGSILPKDLHFFTHEEQNMLYPLSEKIIKIIDSMGYFLLQATRPDTVGVGLLNSPAGLAAYIGERYAACGTNYSHHISSKDGGFSVSGISRDEILTNIMIYYITGSITTSMRFYREFMLMDNTIYKIPIKVPTGLALFPNELDKVPRSLCELIYRNIKQFSVMPKGGHFAALEEPKLLAADIISFVKIIKNSF